VRYTRRPVAFAVLGSMVISLAAPSAALADATVFPFIQPPDVDPFVATFVLLAFAAVTAAITLIVLRLAKGRAGKAASASDRGGGSLQQNSCPACETALSRSSKFCRNCGAPVASAEVPAATPEAGSPTDPYRTARRN
jgi:hypothetical protein